MKRDAVEEDESRRVEELLRINAELAAEIRSLTLGRTGEPRPAGSPAGAAGLPGPWWNGTKRRGTSRLRRISSRISSGTTASCATRRGPAPQIDSLRSGFLAPGPTASDALPCAGIARHGAPANRGAGA